MEVGTSVCVKFAGGGKVNISSVQLAKSIPEVTEKGLQGVGVRLAGSQSLLLDIGVGKDKMFGVESIGLGGGVVGTS